MRSWAVGLVVAVLGMVAVAIALIAVIAVVGRSDATSIVDLEVGDCFDLPDDAADRIDLVDVVPCDDLHEVEVVLVGELNPDGDAEYPADDELFALADERCRLADVDRDRFGLVPFAPTEDTWNGAAGRFACLALPFGGGSITGSIVDGTIDG